MASEINLNRLPKKQRLIYLLTLEDKLFKDYKIDDFDIKMFTFKQNFNVYRYDKFLDERIKPNHFFYYYKDCVNRAKINNSKIYTIDKINDNEWVEEHTIYDKNFKLKIICDDYQMVAYIINEEAPTFELFTFKIREKDSRYILRLEMVFNTIDLEQEAEFENEIKLIRRFENVILQNIK